MLTKFLFALMAASVVAQNDTTTTAAETNTTGAVTTTAGGNSSVTTTAASGGGGNSTTTAASGGGGNSTTQASGGQTTTQASGGQTTTQASGGQTTTQGSGGGGATTTQASGGGGTTQGSQGGGDTTQGSQGGGDAGTTAPGNSSDSQVVAEVKEHVVTAAFSQKMTFASTVNTTSLASDMNFRGGVATGIATHLGVAASKVTILGITVSAARRLTEGRQLAATEYSIKVDYKVAVATAAAATTIEGKTKSGGTGYDASTFASAVSTAVINAASTMDVAVTAVDTTITGATAAVAEVTVLTSGTWTVQKYSDSACTTATGASYTGTIGSTTCSAVHGGDYWRISECGTVFHLYEGNSNSLCGSDTTPNPLGEGVCLPMGNGVFAKVDCMAVGNNGSTSNAVTAGIAMSAGLFALMMM